MPNDEKNEKKTLEKKPKWDEKAKTSYTRMFKMMGTPNPIDKAADIQHSDSPEQTVKPGQTAAAENPKITPAKIKK